MCHGRNLRSSGLHSKIIDFCSVLSCTHRSAEKVARETTQATYIYRILQMYRSFSRALKFNFNTNICNGLGATRGLGAALAVKCSPSLDATLYARNTQRGREFLQNLEQNGTALNSM